MADLDSLRRQLARLEGTADTMQVPANALAAVAIPAIADGWDAAVAALTGNPDDRQVITQLTGPVLAQTLRDPVQIDHEWDFVDDADDDGYATGRLVLVNGTHRMAVALTTVPTVPLPVTWRQPRPEGPLRLWELTIDVDTATLSDDQAADVCLDALGAARSFPLSAQEWVEAVGMSTVVQADGVETLRLVYGSEVDRRRVGDVVVNLVAGRGLTVLRHRWETFDV